MRKALIFGGTTEGRELCGACAGHGAPTLYCVATEDGARPVEALLNLDVRVGRLNAAEMAALLNAEKPSLVVDATHPYAGEARKNIRLACGETGTALIRVRRENTGGAGCIYFDGVRDLLPWLEREPGNIFLSTGSSSAAAFTELTDYQDRIWLRILPGIASLRACLNAGFRPERLICMQGPFSEELNRAMFQSAKARILVTKDSGAAGGFPEKVRAAQSLGMATAVLSRPEEAGGVSLKEACKIIMGL